MTVTLQGLFYEKGKMRMGKGAVECACYWLKLAFSVPVVLEAFVLPVFAGLQKQMLPRLCRSWCTLTPGGA